jgi:hypothetical protein
VQLCLFVEELASRFAPHMGDQRPQVSKHTVVVSVWRVSTVPSDPASEKTRRWFAAAAAASACTVDYVVCRQDSGANFLP